MGAARAGDIEWLCELARPTVALLLNAMPAHLEGFGSVDEVAAAKGEIFDALGEADVAVINADQPWAKQWRKRAGAATCWTLAWSSPRPSVPARFRHGEWTASALPHPPRRRDGHAAVPAGMHNVANALAAIAVGLACDCAWLIFVTAWKRCDPLPAALIKRVAPGVVRIDDCYNANPGSVRAAIDILAGSARSAHAGAGCHERVGRGAVRPAPGSGRICACAGIDQLWGVGPELEVCVDAFGAVAALC